jgi:hypothetical protein
MWTALEGFGPAGLVIGYGAADALIEAARLDIGLEPRMHNPSRYSGVSASMAPSISCSVLRLIAVSYFKTRVDNHDNLLARRWAEGRFNLDSMLAYSAVCSGEYDSEEPGEVDGQTRCNSGR